MDTRQEAADWQRRVWDTISNVYAREIDTRFAAVVAHALKLAQLRAGESVLDLGTGTGAVTLEASREVGADGTVVGVDISSDMLELARRRAHDAGLSNASFLEGNAENIPASDGHFDAIVSNLCFQYVMDRSRAAIECARVLKTGGRFIATGWGGPERCDIVLFQSTAGRFAPAPPVAGVGPGALADPAPFLDALSAAGINADVETETFAFEFANFDLAWDVLAGVTTASLPPERVAEAKRAVQETMWKDPDSPRIFSNETQFVVGVKR